MRCFIFVRFFFHSFVFLFATFMLCSFHSVFSPLRQFTAWFGCAVPMHDAIMFARENTLNRYTVKIVIGFTYVERLQQWAHWCPSKMFNFSRLDYYHIVFSTLISFWLSFHREEWMNAKRITTAQTHTHQKKLNDKQTLMMTLMCLYTWHTNNVLLFFEHRILSIIFLHRRISFWLRVRVFLQFVTMFLHIHRKFGSRFYRLTWHR